MYFGNVGVMFPERKKLQLGSVENNFPHDTAGTGTTKQGPTLPVGHYNCLNSLNVPYRWQLLMYSVPISHGN